MNIIPILLLSLSLPGCAQETKICINYPDIDLIDQVTDFPVVVNLKSTFTDEDILKAQEAIEEWNDAVGETVFVLNTNPDVSKDGCGYVDVETFTLPDKTFGITWHSDCSAIIKITNTNNDVHEYFKEVLMHELGHAIGLHHENYDYTSIMYRYVDDHRLKLSENSIDYIWQVMHCFQ